MKRKTRLEKKPGERFSLIKGARGSQGQRYALSNYGRMISFVDKVEDGKVLKAPLTGGYPTINFPYRNTHKTFLVHRLVAEHFCKRPSKAHQFVIHLDHKKDNNFYKNLKWVTREEKIRHVETNPNVIRTKGLRRKLTEAQVLKIREMLNNPKKKITLKVLAQRYGVSDMQIHRIKTGENWGFLKRK
jgi:hypothetical protein